MDISLWSKIVLGAKFLFGGFEPATDYLLKLLNEFLAKDGVSTRVQQAREYVEKILGYLRKYEKYCPAIWCRHYEKLEDAVQTLVNIFDDNSLSREEIEQAIADMRRAIEIWFE